MPRHYKGKTGKARTKALSEHRRSRRNRKKEEEKKKA